MLIAVFETGFQSIGKQIKKKKAAEKKRREYWKATADKFTKKDASSFNLVYVCVEHLNASKSPLSQRFLLHDNDSDTTGFLFFVCGGRKKTKKKKKFLPLSNNNKRQ